MRRTFAPALLGLAVIAGSAGVASAQTTDEQIQELRKNQEKILKELAEIKKLVQSSGARGRSGPQVANKAIDISGRPVAGDKAAKVALVEITDYQ